MALSLVSYIFVVSLLLVYTTKATDATICKDTDCDDSGNNCIPGLYVANYGTYQEEINCQWLTGRPNYCGDIDKYAGSYANFKSNEMCCACGGGNRNANDIPTEAPTGRPTTSPTVASTCYDTNPDCNTGCYYFGHDSSNWVVGCDFLKDNPHFCGTVERDWWDNNFDSNTMCCACGGGQWINDTENAPTTPSCPNRQNESCVSGCTDDPDWMKKGNKKKCGWVANRPDKRCNKKSTDNIKPKVACGCACEAYNNIVLN